MSLNVNVLEPSETKKKGSTVHTEQMLFTLILQARAGDLITL